MDAGMEVHGHLVSGSVGVGLELLVGVVLVHTEVVAVLGVARRSIHEEFGRNDVVPTQCAHLVAPFPVEAKLLVVGVHVLIGVVPFHIGVDLVVAAVPAQVEAVFVGDFPVELGVEVVEIIAQRELVDARVGPLSDEAVKVSEGIGIGTAKRQVERQFIFHNRAFQIEF